MLTVVRMVIHGTLDLYDVTLYSKPNDIIYIIYHCVIYEDKDLNRVRDNANFLRIYAEILTGT